MTRKRLTFSVKEQEHATFALVCMLENRTMAAVMREFVQGYIALAQEKYGGDILSEAIEKLDEYESIRGE
jgi:hypothetical protein